MRDYKAARTEQAVNIAELWWDFDKTLRAYTRPATSTKALLEALDLLGYEAEQIYYQEALQKIDQYIKVS